MHEFNSKLIHPWRKFLTKPNESFWKITRNRFHLKYPCKCRLRNKPVNSVNRKTSARFNLLLPCNYLSDNYIPIIPNINRSSTAITPTFSFITMCFAFRF